MRHFFTDGLLTFLFGGIGVVLVVLALTVLLLNNELSNTVIRLTERVRQLESERSER